MVIDADALDTVATRLRSAERVCWVTGAGISVASGISPYRKSKDAVWENFITDWGTAARLLRDPLAWYRQFWLQAHPSLKPGAPVVFPNPAHKALSTLLRAKPTHTLITQNIDGLHADAGAPRARLAEIHGRADTFVCTNFKCSMSHTPLTGITLSGIDVGELPECDVCGAVLRPLVLLFDEYYDSQPFYRARDARDWLNDADVIAFVGTSFSVGITAMAVHAAQASGAVVVNLN
ncbi:MAG TPA: Sir2 family NAD-dependent protein deacetylase, partial [Myxococcota bacterium]